MTGLLIVVAIKITQLLLLSDLIKFADNLKPKGILGNLWHKAESIYQEKTFIAKGFNVFTNLFSCVSEELKIIKDVKELFAGTYVREVANTIVHLCNKHVVVKSNETNESL